MIRCFATGLLTCHHGWILLDADQEVHATGTQTMGTLMSCVALGALARPAFGVLQEIQDLLPGIQSTSHDDVLDGLISMAVNRSTMPHFTSRSLGRIGALQQMATTQSMMSSNAPPGLQQRNATTQSLALGCQSRHLNRICTWFWRTTTATPRLVSGWNCGTTTLENYFVDKNQCTVAPIRSTSLITTNRAILPCHRACGARLNTA